MIHLHGCVWSFNTHTLSLSLSGIIGSGLCVFSRHPIVSAHSHQFSVTGGIRDMADGEVFAGKGIIITRIKTISGTVAFYNTHVSYIDVLSACLYE